MSRLTARPHRGRPVLLLGLLAAGVLLLGARPFAPAQAWAALPADGANADTADTSHGLVLIRQAFNAVYRGYFNPVSAADLLHAAWLGATRAATAADPPAEPDLSGPAAGAYRNFAAAYALLEARSTADPTGLAYAAIRGMTGFIHNCHTYFLTPTQAATQRAAGVGMDMVGMGFRRTFTRAPWTVTYVAPGGPAEAAGLHAGDGILAYDGDSSDDAPVVRTAKPEGDTVALTVQRPGEEAPREIVVAIGRYRLPRLESRVVAGNIGYLRFFSWEEGTAQVGQMRDAIAEFERRGVRAWVIDVRANGGGFPSPIARLLLGSGVIAQETTRMGASYTLAGNGDAVTPPRPIAFLVGPGSGSASEIVPEALREAGRALLVGEHTEGCMAGTSETSLDDGSAIWVTSAHIQVGSSGKDFEGVGGDPDIAVDQTAADIASGRDPVLDAAVQRLLAMTADPAP
jgi:carboxyl-terminal processing protease